MSELKQLAEFCAPAATVGVAAGVVAGILGSIAGQPFGTAVVTGLGLGVPLLLFGAGYAALMAFGKVPAGVFAPAAVYWVIAFPLALMAHAIVTEWAIAGSPGLPPEPWKFLAFRALISMGFAIGFLWMHEQLGRHWWPRILPHNRYARRTVEQYAHLAAALEARKAATGRGRKKRVA
ncbi:hypothetical protein HPO96_04850 [Kribbella sandramycini]|uniref:Uncharacterized protein n=1 Tax=Kribbella sandramycini TaxID=60450 RepID=A0A7Y4KVN5_9ACTN|nr:hypothetical protein [Kribbella sandramycini]MBB6567836.1 hypothetical protein [Kribbella sandramycini]NOL39569.1 hypothetical protein [Kribbella sandramycini]